MSRVLNLLSIHQENGLNGLGVWGEGHLAVVHFHLYTQRNQYKVFVTDHQ